MLKTILSALSPTANAIEIAIEIKTVLALICPPVTSSIWRPKIIIAGSVKVIIKPKATLKIITIAADLVDKNVPSALPISMKPNSIANKNINSPTKVTSPPNNNAPTFFLGSLTKINS